MANRVWVFGVGSLWPPDKLRQRMQGLACSIKRTNGDLPLVVLTVKGDLSEESEQAVRKVAMLVHVEDFFVRSLHTQRCGAAPDSMPELIRKCWHALCSYAHIHWHCRRSKHKSHVAVGNHSDMRVLWQETIHA